MMIRPSPMLPTVSLVSRVLLKLCTDDLTWKPTDGPPSKDREPRLSPSPRRQRDHGHWGPKAGP